MRGPAGPSQPITRPQPFRCGVLPARAASYAACDPRRSRDPAPGVPAAHAVAGCAVPAHGPAPGAARRAGRVLGLRARQLAAHAAVPARLARALRGARAARDRRALARLLVRARPRDGRARGASGSRSPTPCCSTRTSRSGALYGNRGWPGRYLFDRRGLLRYIHYGEGDYVETELAIQECSPSSTRTSSCPRRSSRCAPRTRRACCSSRRPPTSRCPPTATGWSWCATGPTARTGSRRPTRAPRRPSRSRAGGAWAVLSGGGLEPGLYETDGTVMAEAPGLRLHGLQFTPAPPAPS